MKNLTEEMVNYIQYGTDEDRQWEFKPPVDWNNPQCRAEIAKNIFALANIPNGGFIIFGISQSQNRKLEKIFTKNGLSNKQFNSFNSTDDVGRYLQGKSNLEVKFNIHGGSIKIDEADRKFIVFQVFESELALPVICIFDSGEICKNGSLYIRSLSNPIESRIIKLNEEWEELILRLLSRKEGIINRDLRALLSNVKRIINPPLIKSSATRKKSNAYDKYLKRDKL
jgi:hypothetical protein